MGGVAAVEADTAGVIADNAVDGVGVHVTAAVALHAVVVQRAEHRPGEAATFENSKTDGPNVVCYGMVDGKTLHERLEGKKGIPPSNMPYTRASADVRLP